MIYLVQLLCLHSKYYGYDFVPFQFLHPILKIVRRDFYAKSISMVKDLVWILAKSCHVRTAKNVK